MVGLPARGKSTMARKLGRTLELDGVKVRIFNNGELRRKLDTSENTSSSEFFSPANPTGAVENKDSVRALVEYANDAGVTVVSDEVYEHFIYGKQHWSAARFGENVITINATSKTYAMTGWRLGYLAAPAEIVAQCVKVHQYCQACATSISQYAALAAYEGDQSPVTMMCDEYKMRRDLFCKGLAALGFSFPVPEGAFYAFVPMKPALTQKIIESGIIVVPGTAFGANAPEYTRFSYATSRQNIMTALERIEKIVK